MARYKPLANISSFVDAQIKHCTWKHLQGQSNSISSFSSRSCSMNTAQLQPGLPKGPHLIEEIQHLCTSWLQGWDSSWATPLQTIVKYQERQICKGWPTLMTHTALINRASTTENHCQQDSSIPNTAKVTVWRWGRVAVVPKQYINEVVVARVSPK